MNNRLEYVDTVFEYGDIFNGGFKKGCRTSDNLFILNGLIEKHRLLGVTLYVCFVDFKRAFDCINLNRHRPKNTHKGILGVF